MPLLLFLLLFLCGSGIAKAMQIRHARRIREICKILLYFDNAPLLFYSYLTLIGNFTVSHL